MRAKQGGRQPPERSSPDNQSRGKRTFRAEPGFTVDVREVTCSMRFSSSKTAEVTLSPAQRAENLESTIACVLEVSIFDLDRTIVSQLSRVVQGFLEESS
jgi:hypothetical protein